MFIKEIVPKPALTFVANTVYKENYETLPTHHLWQQTKEQLTVEYQWRKQVWHSLKVIADPIPVEIAEGSEEEFITEHYWGYARVNNTVTSEYEVVHPRWMVYPVQQYAINVDFAAVYGTSFSFLQSLSPQSVFLAEGSEIQVKAGKRI